MSADIGAYDESPPNDSDARPTISLFEQWEEGAHVTRIANASARNHFSLNAETYLFFC